MGRGGDQRTISGWKVFCGSSVGGLRCGRFILAGSSLLHTYIHTCISHSRMINYNYPLHQPIQKTGYKRNQNIILKASAAAVVRYETLEKCDSPPITAFIKIEKEFEMVRSGQSEQLVITEGVRTTTTDAALLSSLLQPLLPPLLQHYYYHYHLLINNGARFLWIKVSPLRSQTSRDINRNRSGLLSVYFDIPCDV